MGPIPAVREPAASRIKDIGIVCQAAGSQGDVRGDDNVACPGLFGNPVIGRTKTWAHYELDPGVGWHP